MKEIDHARGQIPYGGGLNQPETKPPKAIRPPPRPCSSKERLRDAEAIKAGVAGRRSGRRVYMSMDPSLELDEKMQILSDVITVMHDYTRRNG